LEESIPTTYSETTIPILSLPLLNILFFMSTPYMLGIIKSPLTWWYAKELHPLSSSGFPRQHLSNTFPKFSTNQRQFPLSREELLRLDLVNMYYIHTIIFCTLLQCVLCPYLFWVTPSKLITNPFIFIFILDTWSNLMILFTILYFIYSKINKCSMCVQFW
jgi:hypothetical protein